MTEKILILREKFHVRTERHKVEIKEDNKSSQDNLTSNRQIYFKTYVLRIN